MATWSAPKSKLPRSAAPRNHFWGENGGHLGDHFGIILDIKIDPFFGHLFDAISESIGEPFGSHFGAFYHPEGPKVMKSGIYEKSNISLYVCSLSWSEPPSEWSLGPLLVTFSTIGKWSEKTMDLGSVSVPFWEPFGPHFGSLFDDIFGTFFGVGKKCSKGRSKRVRPSLAGESLVPKVHCGGDKRGGKPPLRGCFRTRNVYRGSDTPLGRWPGEFCSRFVLNLDRAVEVGNHFKGF